MIHTYLLFTKPQKFDPPQNNHLIKILIRFLISGKIQFVFYLVYELTKHTLYRTRKMILRGKRCSELPSTNFHNWNIRMNPKNSKPCEMSFLRIKEISIYRVFKLVRVYKTIDRLKFSVRSNAIRLWLDLRVRLD